MAFVALKNCPIRDTAIIQFYSALSRSEFSGLQSWLHLFPVSFSYASRYLLAVSWAISAGIVTPFTPFLPEVVSQSRRNCYQLSQLLLQSLSVRIG